jgi:Tfp pilus assembly protein PilF
MAIEGPLRELGLHDVFQLLDLSRKTGTLRVKSELRDDEGVVYFAGGRVVHAGIRSLPTSLEGVLVASGRVTEADVASARGLIGPGGSPGQLADALVANGAVSQREVERRVRLQIETVVLELISWREGFFSFEEVPAPDLPVDSRISVSTESLLMEGARRIDEWSRIAGTVPNLQVVPVFAPAGDEHGAHLDLLPHEWEVLTMIDGARDLRGIAGALGRSDFEVAKIAYGLVTTGVVALQPPSCPPRGVEAGAAAGAEALERAREFLGCGDFAAALEAGRMAVETQGTDARLITARALTKLERFADAAEELRRAVYADPLTARVHLDLGFAAVRMGEFATARASWEHFLRLSPSGSDAARTRSALDALTRLMHLLEAHADG